MSALPHKHRRLVDNSLVYWKAKKNRRDVVVAMSPGDQAGCRVLHRLESLKINICDTGQKRVAVVESTTDECIAQYTFTDEVGIFSATSQRSIVACQVAPSSSAAKTNGMSE